MLTGIEKMTSKMRVNDTCRTDENGPPCRLVARFTVVAVMAMVFGMTAFSPMAEAAVSSLDAWPATPQINEYTMQSDFMVFIL